MSLDVGSRLGHYNVTALIGEGGMGQVYQATDTKLNRQVALKILPEAFADDPDRLARFQREAQVLASLNHPGIAAIYGLEDSESQKALVLELVEGPTLADRIARGPIPLDEALPIAKQIAEALEAAHEAGVIHRDLKPANIKVRDDGTVKVLDFGLAKALDPSPTGDPSQSPTLTAAATQMGVIMGTAAYMSPEQARGKPVDKRADILAFGVVLYEILTGDRLFHGEDTSEVLAKVIRDHPSFLRVPAPLHRLLKKCLAKDPRYRLRDIGDAWELVEEDAPSGRMTAVRMASSTRVALTVTGASLVALAGFGYVYLGQQSPVAEQARFSIDGPAGAGADAISVSPDGRHVAFVARDADGQDQVWVRSLTAVDIRALAGTEGAARSGLFWSPDSRFVGFVSQRRLRKVRLTGEPPLTVCNLDGEFRGGAWSPDGVVIFGSGGRGLMQVLDSGGTPSPLTVFDGTVRQFEGQPSFLPDGRHFLYLRVTGDPETTGIYLGSLDTDPEEQNSERLLASESAAVFALAPDGDGSRNSDSPSGYLSFERDRSLMAYPFDAERLTLEREAVSIASDLGSGRVAARGHRYSASMTGVLAYRRGAAEAGMSRLLWYDRGGGVVGQVGSAGAHLSLHLTPGGDQVLVSTEGVPGVEHSWVGDLERNVFTRVNPGETPELASVASADGYVTVTLARGGAAGDIYAGVLNGVGAPELWVENANEKHANDFSPDGRSLIYDEHHPTRRQDLWILPIATDGTPSGEPIPFLTTTADETFGQFSPDGDWIAYESDDSGRREVFVRGYAPERDPPFSTRRWPVSTAGGSRPRWSHDGAELYYVSPEGQMLAVPIEVKPELQLGVPVQLFNTPRVMPGFASYDVSADGRFLINTGGESADAVSTPITVVMNWTLGQ